jgi:hypothetical protein
MPSLNSIPHRTSTTDMEVTSIRLERELKERLKQLADKQGYQALIRDILWDYVQQKSNSLPETRSLDHIRFTMNAIAHRPETCWLTGMAIDPQQPLILGVTITGEWVPLSPSSLPPTFSTVAVCNFT